MNIEMLFKFYILIVAVMIASYPFLVLIIKSFEKTSYIRIKTRDYLLLFSLCLIGPINFIFPIIYSIRYLYYRILYKI